MRIIAGTHRGRRLETFEGDDVRPTADRAREALFSILTSRQAILDAAVLDLFCGTGALGLEALSRGAAEATFVDNDPAAIALVRKNIATCKESGRTRVIRSDATKLGASDRQFNLVLLDPPYGKELVRPTIERLMAGDWLAVGALIVAEIGRKEDPPEIEGLHLSDLRRYGAAKFAFYEPGAAPG
ncbi:MAG TPA: 16S rRNA (guanine(966)-N(2))-methyltransferase RsmD [Geminicoccus sp.]|jgi:16S rRNA (guanine966-N2)-methyltransferase|uniref:16S rRNA (guanine(966)-N(2))-methyltransferase RsmD n=1 Tax=Geminicoccus sp. TaxID=2024832 RepID=UPI002E3268C4|nr:16S rRNA (guanine(966)-N(2))-methyltransferase RsmD [Geminicoccus sp.]HEX2528738.1 16S rRNA (guanine(966)-N(2))-methyltransferase RsmD [Geminicoccus sp.]